MQMLLTTMLVDALHAAFEHGLEAFDRVCVKIAHDMLALAVTGEAVVDKVLVQVSILTRVPGPTLALMIGSGSFADVASTWNEPADRHAQPG